MRPLEVELIFSGAVITLITVADRESVFAPSKVDFDAHINYPVRARSRGRVQLVCVCVGQINELFERTRHFHGLLTANETVVEK